MSKKGTPCLGGEWEGEDDPFDGTVDGLPQLPPADDIGWLREEKRHGREETGRGDPPDAADAGASQVPLV